MSSTDAPRGALARRPRDRCDAMHCAAAPGCSKPDRAFSHAAEAAAGLRPEAAFFIDDRGDNITAAQNCGRTAALWTGRRTVRDLMQAAQRGGAAG